MMRSRAERFRELHEPGRPFILPCAWDVASARLFAEAGHAAIGTTSLGVAAGIGARDEDRQTRAAMTALLRSLRSALPEALLTCDFEDGYASDPAAVVDLLAEDFSADDADGLIIEGINIEDATAGRLEVPEVLATKVAAIKEAFPDLFVNARIDSFWLGAVSLDEVIERIGAYSAAGADGIFVPGSLDLPTITTIAAASPLPVNVLASAEFSRTELAAAGVARISTGSLLYRSAITAGLRSLSGLDDDGPAETADVLSYRAVAELGGGQPSS